MTVTGGNIQISGQVGISGQVSMGPLTAEIIPVTISNTANDDNGGTQTVYSFGGLSFGAADANRKLVVCVSGNSGDGTAVSSLTIGGESASLVVALAAFGNPEIWQADVPTGASGTVEVTFDDTFNTCHVGVFRLIGAASAATDTGTGTNPATDTLNIPAGGVALGGGYAFSGATGGFTWTNLTEDYDVVVLADTEYTGASDAFASEQVALAITCTADAEMVSDTSFAIASWGPA